METALYDILVLSDSEMLSKLVELVLGADFRIRRVLMDSPLDRTGTVPGAKVALVIVALSAYSSEPVVILAQAGLADQIGRTPLLIVSTKAFCSDRCHRIVHLDYPFSAGELRLQVRRMMCAYHPQQSAGLKPAQEEKNERH